MKNEDNLLKSNTPYMLRNDGAILECGEAHPYIKYYFEYDDDKNINELFKHPESLEWYYKNTLQPDVRFLIDEFKKDKSKEKFNLLNKLLNNEFCRVRTSNIKYKYGGDNGEIYFRISSEGFNWFDLIWKTVMDNKDYIKYVTVVRDQQTFGKPYDYYKYKDKELKHISVDEFLTLSGNPIIEKIVKLDNGKYQVQSEKGRNLGTYNTKEEAEERLRQVEYFKHLDEYLNTHMIKEELEEKLDSNHLKRCRNISEKWCFLIFNYLVDHHHPLDRSIHSLSLNGNHLYLNNYQYEFTEKGYILVTKNGEFIKTYKDIEEFLDEAPTKYGFPKIDIKDLYNYLDKGLKEDLNESLLLEKKRSELISKSKSGANYKSKGRENENRWSRRKYSKLSTSVADYNRIDMNTFWKEDILKFGVKVQGETDNYIVQVTFEKILDRLRNEIQRNNNKLEFKNVLRALINTFNSEDVYVECDCPDFSYGGFNHYSYKQGYNADPQFGPAMDAPVIRNPMDNLGAGCKHINLVLSNLSWMMKIASVINNYIWYCKDNMELNYAKYIFPKLYGMEYDRAIQLTLFDTDELESDEATINLSNALGRRRTQFRPKGIEGGNPRFERPKKEEPLENPLKLQFNDEEEKEEVKIVEPEVGNEDEEVE